MSTRVYIGTTEGPAEIQRLTEEPPEIRSVVCLDGRAVALPISRDYESFVRRPTGVVERLWGGAAFRMDVGARVTDGLSWQLPAFLAHALHAAGELAGRGADAGAAVWASGEVDAALDIRPVDAIARKLALSADLLRGLADLRPWVIVPTDAAEAARATLADLGLVECRVVGAATTAAALAALGLALPGAEAPAKAGAGRRPRSRRRIAAATAVLALLATIAAGGWIAWDWRRTVTTWTDQAQSGDLIDLDQTLSKVAAAPACLTCSAEVAHFRSWLADQALPATAQAEATRRAAYGGCPPAATAPAPDRVALATGPVVVTLGACRVRYVVAAPQAALIVASRGGESVATGAGEAAVTIDLPPLAVYGSEQRIVALGSRLPLDKIVPWLRPQLPPAPADPPDALMRRLAAMGVDLRVARHRIEPERGW